MKKVILSVLVAGSLLATSCKKAAEEVKDGVEKTTDEAKKVADEAKAKADKLAEEAKAKVKETGTKIAEMAIPSFGNETVDAYVKEYAGIATKAIADKVMPTDPKFVELTAKLPEMVKTLGDKGGDLTKYIGELTAKMNDAATKK